MKHAVLLLALLPTCAWAGTSSQDASGQGWTLGMGIALMDSPYAGEKTRSLPFPLLAHESERLFFHGTQGGVHLLNRGSFQFDALLSARPDGFDIDDLGRRELAANGVDASLLRDRKHGVDAGLGMTWKGRAGRLGLTAVADISGTSNGYAATADYRYSIPAGQWTFSPGATLRFVSADLAQYYYGIHDEEAARGAPAYRPGSALIPGINLGFARPVTQRWGLYGAVEYRFLPSQISNSPMLEKDSDGLLALTMGMSYKF